MAKIKTTKKVAKEWIEGVDELSQELTEDSKAHRKEANEHKKQANTLNQISDGIKETLNIKAKGGSVDLDKFGAKYNPKTFQISFGGNNLSIEDMDFDDIYNSKRVAKNYPTKKDKLELKKELDYLKKEQKKQKQNYAKGGSVGKVKVEIVANGMPIKEYQNQSVEELMEEKPLSLAKTKERIFNLNEDAIDYKDEIKEAKDIDELVEVLDENDLIVRDNTYNQSWWGGTYEYAYLKNGGATNNGLDLDYETIMFISKHIGVDVRAGYTSFEAFDIPNYGYESIPFFMHRQTIILTATNGKKLIADTEDMEGYELYVVEDNIGDMDEGDSTNLEDLGELYGFEAYKYYAKGGEVKDKKRYDIDEYSSQSSRTTENEYIERTNDFDELVEKITKRAKDKKIPYIEFYYKDSFIGSINEKNDYKFRIGRGYDDNPLKSKNPSINKQRYKDSSITSSYAKGGEVMLDGVPVNAQTLKQIVRLKEEALDSRKELLGNINNIAKQLLDEGTFPNEFDLYDVRRIEEMSEYGMFAKGGYAEGEVNIFGDKITKGFINKQFLSKQTKAYKDRVLKKIAEHYGTTPKKIEKELYDNDAEMMYEYIGNDSALRNKVYHSMEHFKKLIFPNFKRGGSIKVGDKVKYPKAKMMGKVKSIKDLGFERELTIEYDDGKIIKEGESSVIKFAKGGSTDSYKEVLEFTDIDNKDKTPRIRELFVGITKDGSIYSLDIGDRGADDFSISGDTNMKIPEDSAEESTRDSLRDMYEQGEYNMDYISDSYIDEDWFITFREEDARYYAEDIKEEDDDEYKNRLVQEMVEMGVIDEEQAKEEDFDEDDYIDEFVEKYTDDGYNAIDYYRDNFGDEQFKEMVRQNNLLDIDGILDYQDWRENFDNSTLTDEVEGEDGETYLFQAEGGGQNDGELDNLAVSFLPKKIINQIKSNWKKYHLKKLPKKDFFPEITQDRDAILEYYVNNDNFGSGGFLLGSMLGGYMGYKLGLSQEKREDLFANERKFAKKVKDSATKRDDD